MSFATLDDLRSTLGGTPQITPAYSAKMLHPIPVTTEVDRNAFIVKQCAGKRVLDFGASGVLHDQIVKAAALCVGIDRDARDGVLAFDLDDVSQTWIPPTAYRDGLKWDLLVCGELLEHLTNPGYFLTRLHRQYFGVPLILSVPNAFAKGAQQWLAKGLENVNADHVAWYSPHTISVLLERAGYATGGLYWYGGNGPTAEGLLVVAE